MIDLSRAISSSSSADTTLSGAIFACEQINFAVGRPIPNIYGSANIICFSRGKSTPAIRAILNLLDQSFYINLGVVYDALSHK
jgi:hypothetical protein